MKTNKLALLVIIISTSFFTSCNKNKDVLSNSDLQETYKSDGNFVAIDKAVDISRKMQNSLPHNANDLKLLTKGKRFVHTISVKDNSSKPAYYIINNEKGGFSIISADNRTQQILAFSETGYFDTTSVPSGLNKWLYLKKEEIDYIRNDKSISTANSVTPLATPSAVNGEIRNYTSLQVDSVLPLVKSSWNQGAGFNDNCPQMNCSKTTNQRAWAGCVAIAIGQVMFYHKYPANYNWNAMSNYYGTPESANLIKDIGDKVSMEYGCDGSGADGIKTISCLNNYNYSASSMDINIANSDDITLANVQMFKSELKAGKPMIMTGGKQGTSWVFFNKYEDGHEWVFDGYKTFNISYQKYSGAPPMPFGWHTFYGILDYYHMNWGWGGSYDGYFALSALNPGQYKFNYKLKLFYNIQPNN